MDVLTRWSPRHPAGVGSPFVTFYDIASAERTELSGTTTANWVSKVANLLVDDLDVEPGVRVTIDLPVHWLRPVWILATWAVGGTIAGSAGDVHVCGPDGLGDAPLARHRVASALLPFSLPFAEPPANFIDLGRELPGQPDAFIALHEASPNEVAVDLTDLVFTYADLSTYPGSAERLLFGPGKLARDVRATLAAARGGGSLVLVDNGDTADIERIARQEAARII